MEIEKPNKIYLAELVENGGCYPEWRTKPYEAAHKNHEYIKKEVIENLLKKLKEENNGFYPITKTIDTILEKIEEI